MLDEIVRGYLKERLSGGKPDRDGCYEHILIWRAESKNGCGSSIESPRRCSLPAANEIRSQKARAIPTVDRVKLHQV